MTDSTTDSTTDSITDSTTDSITDSTTDSTNDYDVLNGQYTSAIEDLDKKKIELMEIIYDKRVLYYFNTHPGVQTVSLLVHDFPKIRTMYAFTYSEFTKFLCDCKGFPETAIEFKDGERKGNTLCISLNK